MDVDVKITDCLEEQFLVENDVVFIVNVEGLHVGQVETPKDLNL